MSFPAKRQHFFTASPQIRGHVARSAIFSYPGDSFIYPRGKLALIGVLGGMLPFNKTFECLFLCFSSFLLLFFVLAMTACGG